MKNRILVVAAHPDDEFLGCGGTLINHKNKGDDVGILIMSEGSTSRDKKRNIFKRKKELLELKKVASDIANQIKAKFVKFNSFPDNRMDSVNFLDVVKKVEKIIKIFKPNIIYTHHPCDLNIDHNIVYKAVMTASRPVPNQSVIQILLFETLSSTNWSLSNLKKNNFFNPNYFNEIPKSSLKIKLNMLSKYKGEMKKWPHSRSLKSVKALAHYRGSSIGCDAAEAFVLERHIVKNK